MADADEDTLLSSQFHRPAGSEDGDLEDETQDFRFLSSLLPAKYGDKSQQSIPKRGEKDFEPNPTLSQTSTLDASRSAMHSALSAVRVHVEGKTYNVGQLVSEEMRAKDARLRPGKGRDWGDRSVVVYNFKGVHAKVVGRADRRSWTWLLPEEALFLLERGSLDVRWPDVDIDDKNRDMSFSGRDNEGAEDQLAPTLGEIPMSLQGAYAAFLGQSGLTLDRYLVYANLRRTGYIVMRAPTWYDNEDAQADGDASHPHEQSASLDQAELASTSTSSTPTQPPSSSIPILINRLLSYLINPRLGHPCPSHGPLLAPGLYRSYLDIFRSLSLIPHHNVHNPTAMLPSIPPLAPKPPYTVAWSLWRSNQGFKKSSPPPPTYHICVLDARSSSVPTIAEIGNLLNTTPIDELSGAGEKRIEQRIKHGKRSVLLAVVDTGVVSYLRFAEAAVGSYRLYEAKAGKGTKRGGRRGAGKRGGKR